MSGFGAFFLADLDDRDRGSDPGGWAAVKTTKHKTNASIAVNFINCSYCRPEAAF
jgi:hypothetical protein